MRGVREPNVRPRSLVLAGALAAALVASSACSPRAPQVDALPEVVDFNFHVRPILSDRCFACHGPDDRARKAGLRLDTEAGAFAVLESGRRAIVPRSTRRSELVHRILSSDPAVMMPTPESHLALTDYERALLVRWVEQGATWKPHWAFIPPARPTPPATNDNRPNASEIDAFVVARLAPQGLAPSPEATRETLLRRVTMDLTGLPPTVDEVDAFLRDDQPGAYERVVDRLLASPAYGERMAAEWLDVARYADSHGYQDDGMRDMSPWRDWVIAAFNRNLRFDDFITWQLAGDLLPQPSHEQVLATAFNRHHMQSQEGGIVPEEYRVEYVADRVDTLGRAFLGLTMDCARCHDHKYDPVLQREYFELFGFFNSNNESGQIPYSGMPSPTLVVGHAEADATVAELRARIRALEAQTAIDTAALDAPYAAWLARAAGAPAARRVAPGDLLAHLPLDGSELKMVPEQLSDEERRKRQPKLVPRRFFENRVAGRPPATLGGDRDRIPDTVPGPTGQGQRLVGDSFIDLGRDTGQFERHQPFSFALWFRIDKAGTAGPLVTRSAGVFSGNRGFEVMLHADGRLTAALHHTFPDSSIEIATEQPVAPGEWRHLVFAYDGSSRAAGIRIFLDGQPAATRIVVDNLQRSILTSGNPKQPNWTDMPGLRIGKRHDETLDEVSVDDLRLYGRQLTAVEVAALHGAADPIGDILQIGEERRTEAQRAALREYFAVRVDRSLAAARRELQAVRGEENAVVTALPEVMVMRELPQPRPTFILDRGAYDAPTERVEPGTPHAIGRFPDSLPKNRLGLATWLLEPQHPLTARVIVNRYWALFFGAGIVATLEDFGSQGELPTHPELLDWLAVTFVESGWDVKALHKRIVTSATYRQATEAPPAIRERDPDNRWLARGPSHRYTAEQIRDAALAASGLLVPTIGGRSVYPYQPPGLWEELATRNETTYVQGRGDDLYRRSLYTVWKRSTPPPSAISFDAAQRLSCTVQRQRTSTPLQALVLMNDPQYVEAARLLAERMAREGGADPADRVALGFRLMTSRRPTGEESRVLVGLYEEEHARFRSDPEAPRKLLAIGERARDPKLDAAEIAALTVVANTLMSVDEAVTKR
jgi:hypothetical protein